jgi:hypothetical protein
MPFVDGESLRDRLHRTSAADPRCGPDYWGSGWGIEQIGRHQRVEGHRAPNRDPIQGQYQIGPRDSRGTRRGIRARGHGENGPGSEREWAGADHTSAHPRLRRVASVG